MDAATLDMSTALVADSLTVTHLVAMAIGLAAMIATDLSLVRRAGETIHTETVFMVALAHRILAVALSFAWVSGLCLAALATGLDPAALTPLLAMKLIVVTILSIAALLTPRMVLPALRRCIGRPLLEAEFDDKIRMALASGLAIASWALALVLGSSVVAETAGWSALIPFALAVYLIAITLMLRHALSVENTQALATELAGRLRYAWPGSRAG